MKQTIYIGASENGLYLEIEGIGKSGEAYRKRTNKEAAIGDYLAKNAIQFVDAVVKGENLKIYTNHKTVIVIRNYAQLRNHPTLKVMFRRLNRAPIVSENLKQNERTNLIQALQLKILYANKKKLAALALTGSLFVTVGLVKAGAVISNFDVPALETTNTVVEELLKKNPNIVEKETDIPVVDVIEEVDELSEFSERLAQTLELQSNYDGYDNSKIMLGARVNSAQMERIQMSEMGKTIIEIANTYGVDPYLLIAKGLTESSLEHEACCPNGSRYNGYGVGAFQLEKPDGRIVKAWNYKINSEDSLSVTMENAVNFKTNAQAAAMYLQNRIDLYNGNIYLAIQSYNYGEGMMKIVIHDYAKQMGITEEDVKNNINDLGWLAIVDDIHRNPNNYYYRVMIDLDEQNPEIIAAAKANYVWKHGTYGNPHYLADVLSYYVGLQSQNKNLNGTSTVINFSTHEITQIEEEPIGPKLF